MKVCLGRLGSFSWGRAGTERILTLFCFRWHDIYEVSEVFEAREGSKDFELCGLFQFYGFSGTLVF